MENLNYENMRLYLEYELAEIGKLAINCEKAVERQLLAIMAANIQKQIKTIKLIKND